MTIYNEPAEAMWPQLLQRPTLSLEAILQKVKPILAAVRQDGDAAIANFSQQFDGFAPAQLKATDAEFAAAEAQLDDALKSAIQQAAANIRTFHSRQWIQEEKVTTMPGIVCYRKWTGIEKVGLYIPGGTAPLFSTVLMLGIPASIVGCQKIVMCTPPNRDGLVHPAILYAAQVARITEVYKVGGAQAIAAMAYGTATVPKVYKIFGPGNQYVTAAKQLVQLDGLAIDMPAGPSEVCVWADATSNPAYVAADLLSQAEHGSDSQVLLVSSSMKLIENVKTAIAAQVEALPRKELAAQALDNSRAICLTDKQKAATLINQYAAEHLIICTEDPEADANAITNAGSIFLGTYTPESVGDYASGTNHTLPTNGYAMAYSGVSVDSFVKKITVQQLSREGLAGIAPTVIAMAEAEGLQAHAKAVRIRLT
jgi:histidinol dehydrogenase